MKRKARTTWDMCSHYVIEGVQFHGANGVYRHAKDRGYTGSAWLIGHRLRNGACTWAALLMPPAESSSKGGIAAKKSKREKMADVIATLDARKREMGL